MKILILDTTPSCLKEELIALANETPESVEIVTQPMANAMTVDSDGWALLATYGDHPHSRGIQRFTRSAAEELVSHFKSLGSRIKRAFVGVPIYRGHPDNQDFANVHKDKSQYGQVADLAAREDGLFWKPILNDEGAKLVEQGFEFGSINWGCTPLANRVFQPVQALSVGLTDRPNLPTQSLSNASSEDQPDNNTNNKDTTMPTWLLELLGLAPEATEEEVKTALTALMEKAKADPEKSDAPAEMANEVAQAKATIVEMQSQLKGVTEELANERKKRREQLVADALEEGRILANEKDDWTRRLEKDFDNESKALANAAPAFSADRHSSTVRPGAQTSNREGEITTLVKKRQNETGETWDRAFANCKADPAHAALFA